jgi:hypothetical protein
VAKKSKKVVDLTPRFYVHYDTNNKIVSVNNFRDTTNNNAIEVDFDQYERLLLGKEKFEDFHIGTVIDASGNSSVGLVSHKLLLEHNFKNRLLAWIEDESENHDILIGWDEYNGQWIFSCSEDLKTQFLSNQFPTTEISFYIILGNDPNFLIRTITIDLKDLISKPIIAKFNTEWERIIDTIAITSNISSLSYSLKTWKIDEQN